MKTFKTFLFASLVLVTALSSCTSNDTLTASRLDPAKFDTVINEKPVKLYVLKNDNKMEVCVTNFGARIVSITLLDKNNNPTDVTLGYDNIAQYADTVNNASDFGAAIGRYANRINKGKLTVSGKKYQLPRNNYGHCLHGGPSGWQYQVFDAKQVNDTTLQLTLQSPDGDNNFPGNVTATVTYTLLGDNTLDCVLEAATDAETVVNMTNHTYFNLSGNPAQHGMDMVLYVNADQYTPIDSTFMTTGEIKPVYGTPMDFNRQRALSTSVGDTSFVQIKYASGYDHNFVLNTYRDGKGDDNKVAASLYSPQTGIFMQLFTNQPGIQIYSGNFLNGKIIGKRGIAYPAQAAVCLEPQTYPDAPNKKNFPSPYLKPGETYHNHIAYKFSIK